MAGGWDSLGLLPELVQACEEDFNWILPSDVSIGSSSTIHSFIHSFMDLKSVCVCV